MNITKATAQGLRSYQEDRFVVSKTIDGLLVAIMDGHGGAETSSRLAKALPQVWRKFAAETGSPDWVQGTQDDIARHGLRSRIRLLLGLRRVSLLE